tara:strand:+ start:22384 stop:22995 length:612 start_codon:yes stop_codon:yes gene_type:complete
MSSDSTNIENLPTQTKGNMEMRVSEQPVMVTTQQSQPTPGNNAQNNINIAPKTLDQNQMSNVMQGLQQAEMQGATSLNSRDIPMNTLGITQDNQTKPNFIPEEQGGYIEEQNVYDSMKLKKENEKQREEKMDYMYDEFQLPILIMVLFFMFQLPFVKNKFISLFPTLFLRDGNISLGGYTVKTLLFGACFYFIVKATKYASEY